MKDHCSGFRNKNHCSKLCHTGFSSLSRPKAPSLISHIETNAAHQSANALVLISSICDHVPICPDLRIRLEFWKINWWRKSAGSDVAGIPALCFDQDSSINVVNLKSSAALACSSGQFYFTPTHPWFSLPKASKLSPQTSVSLQLSPLLFLKTYVFEQVSLSLRLCFILQLKVSLWFN